MASPSSGLNVSESSEDKAPTEKLHKAAGLTIASAVTGGLRDLLVLFALGRSRRSDGFFALFLVTQFLYTVAVGGHLITLGRIAGLGRKVRTHFFHAKFAPRLRRMSIVCVVVVLPMMKFVYEQSWLAASVIAVLSAGLLICRGQAEFRSYIAISEALNTAMLAAIWQNVLIIVAAVGCWLAGIQNLAVIVVGIVLGFAVQAFHLRKWAPGLRARGVSNVVEHEVSWEVSSRELLWFGGPALESLMMGGLPGGVYSILVMARRIAVTIPISFAVPLGFRLISDSHDEAKSRSNGAQVMQSVSVLVIIGLAIVQAAIVVLRMLAFAEHRNVSLGPIAKFDLPTLLPLTAAIALGSICFALHHALSRYQQALGDERRAVVTTAIATVAQIVGVLAGVLVKSVLLVGITFSLAWLMASIRDITFVTRWRYLERDLRTVLVWFPLLFVITSTVVVRAPFTSPGMEVLIWIEGCLPLLAYFWGFQQARRGSQGSWI